MPQSILSMREVYKDYPSGGNTVHALAPLNLELHAGDVCAVTGPSGSGKTTLLALAAGLEPVSGGDIILGDHKLAALTEEERTQVRRDMIGFIFQDFQLLPSLTALQNVSLPASLKRDASGETRARELLDAVGLSQRHDHYPDQLSGGEQQRVSIARAFINHPKILFADEPTGSLDSETSDQICDLIFELNRSKGTTLLLVTHDNTLAARAPLRLDMTKKPLQVVATS